MYAGGGWTCEQQKGGKKIFRRERRRGREEKKIFGRERKKFWRQREHNPQKDLRTVESRSNKKDSGGPGGYPPDKNSSLFSLFVPIIGTVQPSLSNVRASVRPIDAWKRAGTEVRRGARRVPRSDARRKKENPGRRMDARGQKGGEKIFRREGKKNDFGGSEKKFWRQRGHNPQKDLRTVEKSSFYPIPLRSI
jgi:hypothetical protein